MEELFDQQIVSVFVEGGAQLHESFLKSGLWDEARVFTGKMSFGQGVKAPVMQDNAVEKLVFKDMVLELFSNHPQPFH